MSTLMLLASSIAMKPCAFGRNSSLRSSMRLDSGHFLPAAATQCLPLRRCVSWLSSSGAFGADGADDAEGAAAAVGGPLASGAAAAAGAFGVAGADGLCGAPGARHAS